MADIEDFDAFGTEVGHDGDGGEVAAFGVFQEGENDDHHGNLQGVGLVDEVVEVAAVEGLDFAIGVALTEVTFVVGEFAGMRKTPVEVVEDVGTADEVAEWEGDVCVGLGFLEAEACALAVLLDVVWVI